MTLWKYIKSTALAFLLCSCGPRGYFDTSESTIIYQTIQNNNEKLAKIGLYEHGNGGAGYPLTTTIAETYITKEYQFESVEETRQLFCKVVDEFLHSLNSESSIRPLVQDFPLTAKNLDLSIIFFDKNGSPLMHTYISNVMLINGQIRYYYADNGQLLHTESYEEAKKLLAQAIGN